MSTSSLCYEQHHWPDDVGHSCSPVLDLLFYNSQQTSTAVAWLPCHDVAFPYFWYIILPHTSSLEMEARL
jgi:hypothetical protein